MHQFAYISRTNVFKPSSFYFVDILALKVFTDFVFPFLSPHESENTVDKHIFTNVT